MKPRNNRISRFFPENRLERYFSSRIEGQPAPAESFQYAPLAFGKTLAMIEPNKQFGAIDLLSGKERSEFDQYFHSLVISFSNYGEQHCLDEDINLDYTQVQGDIKRYIQAAKHNATDKELRSGMDVNKNFIACLSQDLFGNAIALIKNENFISFANKKIISLAELKDFVSTLYYMKY